MKHFYCTLILTAAVGMTTSDAFAKAGGSTGGGGKSGGGQTHSAGEGSNLGAQSRSFGNPKPPVSGTYKGMFNGSCDVGNKITINGRNITFSIDGEKHTKKATFFGIAGLQFSSGNFDGAISRITKSVVVVEIGESSATKSFSEEAQLTRVR